MIDSKICSLRTVLALCVGWCEDADGIILLVVGFAIIVLGNMATFFKVNTDIIEKATTEYQDQQEEPLTNQTVRCSNTLMSHANYFFAYKTQEDTSDNHIESRLVLGSA